MEMESDTRESRWDQAGQGRAMNGEKSPAGSVKRARQRAAAGLPPEERPEMPPPNPRGILTNASTRSPQNIPSPRHRNQYPQHTSHGSRQASTPPRAGQDRRRKGSGSSEEQESSPRQEHGMGRGPTPQRPPRPNYVPPMLESTRYQDNQQSPQMRRPSHDQSPRNYWEGDSPDGLSGYSSGSRPSTTATGSSTASIPDFPPIPSMPPMPPMPVPTYQPPPRRNLGPPPSARKGGSSYYSQSSFVPPIPEELSEKSHSSYASSHVIPVSWGDGPPSYYMGNGINEEDEDEENARNHSEDSSGRESKSSEHEESSNLVRKGPRQKQLQPFMDSIESGDESDISGGRRGRRELDWQAKQDERFQRGFGPGPGQDPIGRHNFKGSNRLHPYSGYESDATFLDSPLSTSPGMSRVFQGNDNSYFGTPSSGRSPIDPRVGQILGHLEKGGALASSGTASPSPPSSNDRGMKRPPKLNLQGSKGATGRGSNTSLPELIRRATRLASNLDRGKTASRIGMLDMLNASDREKRERTGKGSRDGSISDMLAAFPSTTPTASPGHRPSNWPGSSTPHGKSNLSRTHTVTYGSQRSYQHRGRRCCGIPLWAFVLLLIIVLLLIAAAVVIPVTLVVLPKQNKNSAPSLSDCQTNDACQNGGTSLVVNKGCRCVCSNGYTGSTCNAVPDSGCTGMDLPLDGTTTFKNATLGSSIPRLLTAAQKNYSIPMSGYVLASLFSQTNFSCSSENALVTFAQKSQRREIFQPHIYEPEQPLKPPSPILIPLIQILWPTPTPQPLPTRILEARASAQTSNNIIFAAPAGGVVTGAPAAATSTPPSSVVNGKPITATTLDFARTAVLFILQETSSLDITTVALEKLQALLNSGVGGTFDASQTGAGGNITVDLGAFTVSFGNGTTYGEKTS